MNSEPQPQEKTLFRWQINSLSVCFFIIFLPVTVTLGFWQLHRAEDKQAIISLQHERLEAVAVDFRSLVNLPDNQFKTVTTPGKVDSNRILLLDNRMRQGRPGFEILAPLSIPIDNTSLSLLVNYGWIKGGKDRSKLPSVPALDDIKLTGYLYRSPRKRLVLKEDVWVANQWPLIIQTLDIEKLSVHLGVELFPFVLRITDEPMTGLDNHWPIDRSKPEKHVGYALQWFLLAFALTVLSVFANTNLGDVLRRKQTGAKRG
jgi:surfeit locus 1 family protein